MGKHLVVCIVLLISGPALADFNYSNFNVTTGLDVLGNARIPDGTLHLTPDTQYQIGMAYTQVKQPVVGGFTSTFQFRMTPGSAPSADGIFLVLRSEALVPLQPYPVGLPWTTNTVVLELDNYCNLDQGDPNDHHAAIMIKEQSGGHNHVNCRAVANTPYLVDSLVHTARLSYVPGTMTVFLDNMSTPLISLNLDLAATGKFPDGKAFVGIEGECGSLFSQQDVLSWSYTSVPEPASMSLILLGGLLMGRRICRRAA